MIREQVYAELNKIFQEVFDDDSLVISDETTSDDIEDWDSLEQINLIVAVEKRFCVKFKMEDILNLRNVGEMIDIILKYQKH